MLLEVIPMIFFGILRIFGEKSQKSKNWKSGHIKLLRRSVGNLRRGVELCQGVRSLAVARPRCQNCTPRVRRGIALRFTPHRSNCSQREKFWIFFPKV